MTDTTIDPYGGFQEEWSVDVLNTASQDATIAFTHKAIRPMPRVNQITFPDAAHFEICGFDVLSCCAYAVGYIEDVAETLRVVLADARSLGYDPGKGSDKGELMTLAARRGWDVVSVPGHAGDVAQQLATQDQVGLTALNTAYGTGAQWNVLHPAAQGNVGHWEGIGAVLTPPAAPPEDVEMTMDHARLHVFEWYVVLDKRVPQQSEVDYWAERLTKENIEAVYTDFINSPEIAAKRGF